MKNNFVMLLVTLLALAFSPPVNRRVKAILKISEGTTF
jgi:hypothetical protein